MTGFARTWISWGIYRTPIPTNLMGETAHVIHRCYAPSSRYGGWGIRPKDIANDLVPVIKRHVMIGPDLFDDIEDEVFWDYIPQPGEELTFREVPA